MFDVIEKIIYLTLDRKVDSNEVNSHNQLKEKPCLFGRKNH